MAVAMSEQNPLPPCEPLMTGVAWGTDDMSNRQRVGDVDSSKTKKDS